MVAKCCCGPSSKKKKRKSSPEEGNNNNNSDQERLLKRASLDSSFTNSSIGALRSSHHYEDDCDAKLERRKSTDTFGKSDDLVIRSEPDEDHSDLIDLTSTHQNNRLNGNNAPLLHKVTFCNESTLPQEQPEKPKREKSAKRSRGGAPQVQTSPFNAEFTEGNVESVQLSQKASETSIDALSNKSPAIKATQADVKDEVDEINKVSCKVDGCNVA